LKLLIEIDGQTLEVEFHSANGSARLQHAGRSYEALVSEPEPGLLVVLLDGRVYRCALDRLPDGAEVVVNGARRRVAVRDRKRMRAGSEAGGRSGGRVTLVAPMPGKVVRVLCAAGDEVAAQQGVLVVEAMKMQNEVQAPRAGKIIEVRVREGQTVNAGEVMAIVE
jgi:biotin carboxyl carrier protein